MANNDQPKALNTSDSTGEPTDKYKWIIPIRYITVAILIITIILVYYKYVAIDISRIEKAIDKDDASFILKSIKMHPKLLEYQSPQRKESLLHRAASAGKVKVADVLLTNGANPQCNDILGVTPLFYACEGGKTDIVSLFIAHGVLITVPCSNWKVLPLEVAVAAGRTETVKYLLKHNASAITGSLDPPILSAINQCGIHRMDGSVETESTYANIIEILIRNGANVNCHLKNGETPLFHAILKNHFILVKTLIEHGANINWRDKNGNTPLDVANKYHSQQAIITYLLNHNAIG